MRKIEVVLASDDIVNANAISLRDLLTVLTGEANKFAVVARFNLETFPQGQIVVTSLVNSADLCDALFKGSTKITNATMSDVILIISILLYFLLLT